MQITNKDLKNLTKDAARIALVVGDSLKGKKWEKVHKNFSDIVEWLPEYNEDGPDDEKIFVKHKVMRRVQKRWYSATVILYNSSGRKNLKVNSDYWAVQHVIVTAFERMSWIETWMIEQITKEISSKDPDELEEVTDEWMDKFNEDPDSEDLWE